MIQELAPAKVNLLLHVGPRRSDGLHELCSIFASIDLVDEVLVGEAAGGRDRVVCRGVEGPNACAAAIEAFRDAVGSTALPPLEVTVEKRIPVAAGLGGGSADAGAVLRAANAIAGRPLDAAALRAVGASVGADVPSQIEPRHALVEGAGELVEPLELPSMTLVLVPQAEGLSTAAVYREADRLGVTRERLHAEPVRAAAAGPLTALAGALENDLQAAALSLRPELAEPIAELRRAGAVAALVTGSGPTVFGVFDRSEAAHAAAAAFPAAVTAGLR